MWTSKVEELEKDRNKFRNYSEEDFLNNYQITDNMLAAFGTYLNQKARYRIPFAAYNEEIKLHLKANFAEQLFNDEVAVKVLNTNDEMLETVFELSEFKY